MDMAFDKHKTLAVITAWPNGLVSPDLLIWLHDVVGLSWRQIHWHTKGDRCVCVAYNYSVEFALKSTYDHFIFCDNDIQPDKDATRPFLFAPGDVICVGYKTGNRRSWDDPGVIHCGMWRTDRKFLEQVKPPWFQWPINENGSELTNCVCAYLRQKLNDEGIHTGHAGWAIHTPKQQHT